MILTDSPSQTLALGVFSALGLLIGLLFWGLWQLERAFGTKLAFNLIAEVILTACVFVTFTLVEFFVFDLDVAVYHVTITICVSGAAYGAMRFLLRKKQAIFHKQADNVKERLKKNRFIKRIFR